MNNIAIIGNDLAAWMTAALLAVQPGYPRPRLCIYTGVSPSDNSSIQTPLPDFSGFLAALGISVQELAEQCSALPTLGNCYHLGHTDFYHTWGEYGAPLGAIEFHQLYVRALHAGTPLVLNDLSLAAVAAAQSRFAVPEANKLSIRSTYEASCAFSTQAFVQLLQHRCRHYGVEINERAVDAIAVNNHQPRVILADGEAGAADFIFNTCPALCTNTAEYESWEAQLPFSKSVIGTVSTTTPRLASDVRFDEGYWEISRHIRTQTEISRYTIVSKEAQVGSVNMGAAGCLLNSRAQQVIHLGAAAVNIPSPLFSDADLIWIALRALLKFYPSRNESSAVALEYNNLLVESYRNLRDITQICMLLAERQHPAFLLNANQCPQSDQLLHKLALFSYRGKMPVYENEVYKIQWQVWLLLGFGVIPECVEPITMHLRPTEMVTIFSKVKEAVNREVGLLPAVY